MRKLFISQSLRHAPGYGIQWHVGRVKLMEDMWASICRRDRV
jgi:hypothetical protein